MTRRALAGLAIAVAALAARAVPAARTEPEAAAIVPVEPGEVASALLLGPFKPVAASVLFVRLDEAFDRGDYGAVLPLADWITAIDPENERVWWFAGWTLAVQIPGFGEGVPPGELWAWRKAGLRKLRQGAARNPRSWRLRVDEAWLVYYHVRGQPDLERRFLADRDVNPEGLTAARYAARRFAEAAELGAPFLQSDAGRGGDEAP